VERDARFLVRDGLEQLREDTLTDKRGMFGIVYRF